MLVVAALGSREVFLDIAIMSTVILGFNVEPLAGEWKLPAWATRSLVDAITKPSRKDGVMGVRMSRREGWEKVLPAPEQLRDIKMHGDRPWPYRKDDPAVLGSIKPWY